MRRLCVEEVSIVAAMFSLSTPMQFRLDLPKIVILERAMRFPRSLDRRSVTCAFSRCHQRPLTCKKKRSPTVALINASKGARDTP